MEVLIVSKTHMSSAACIGAVAENGRYLRLLDNNGYNQPTNTNFEIGQVWNIEFHERYNNRSPHTEDILVISRRYVEMLTGITMLDAVARLNIPIWRGSPDILFQGLLEWTDGGSGYISINGTIPDNSVGFWIPDRDLTKSGYTGHTVPPVPAMLCHLKQV